jgi:hypothetical protein
MVPDAGRWLHEMPGRNAGKLCLSWMGGGVADDEPDWVSHGAWLLAPLHALLLQERIRKCDRGRFEAASIGDRV